MVIIKVRDIDFDFDSEEDKIGFEYLDGCLDIELDDDYFKRIGEDDIHDFVSDSITTLTQMCHNGFSYEIIKKATN